MTRCLNGPRALLPVVLGVLSLGASPTLANPSASFRGEEALGHARRMLELGQRHYGAELRSTAIEQLVEALARHVDNVHQQRFVARERGSGQEHALVNIIGRRNPTATPRVLLGSHYDTRLWAEEDADTTRRGQPIDGANDGTSGVAVLLELLRVVSETPELRDLGIDVVLFDGEEFGRPGSDDYCKGSVYFVRHLDAMYPSTPPTAAILVDMVGDRELKIRRERSSNAILSRRLSDVIWRHGQAVAPEVFVDEGVGQIIDDQSAFHTAGIPAVLIIDLEYEHWHTHQDTLNKISAASMEVVGKTLKAALPGIFALNSGSRQGAAKP